MSCGKNRRFALGLSPKSSSRTKGAFYGPHLDTLHKSDGPMKFRLVLQPCMAAFFAIRAGLADAKAGKPPYFWCLLTSPAERDDMLKDGWKGISRVFILALALDVVY